MSTVHTMRTDHLPVRDRVARWEEYSARQLVGLRCSTYHHEGLNAEQHNLHLDGVQVADIVGNAHVIDRTLDHVAHIPRDDVFVSMLLTGSAFFHHAGGSFRVAAGDVVVYDTAQPYLFGFDSPMRQLLLGLPRSTLSRPPGCPCLISGSGNTSARGQLRDLMSTALAAASHTAATRSNLVAAAETLLAPTSALDRLREQCLAIVEERLLDPSLGAAAVAAQVGASVRHLHRAFAPLETTPTRYIQRRRLEEARRELLDATFTDRRIATIAARWGFSSQAHFTRAYRRHFGVSPMADRAAAG